MRTLPVTLGRLWAVVALIEATTWLGLLVGMFLKYVTVTTDAGVHLFGPLHGGAFVVYAVVTIAAAIALRWPWWLTLIALAASIPPLATVPLEIILAKRGWLRPRKPSDSRRQRRTSPAETDLTTASRA